MRRVGFMIWKELIELKGDPRLFGLVIVAPILQLFMLGYAATTDVRDVPIVVADADRSAASRDLIARFDASPNFTIAGDRDQHQRGRPVSRSGTRLDGAGDPRRLRRDARARRSAEGAGDRRRQRRELDQRRDGLRDEPDRRLFAGADGAADAPGDDDPRRDRAAGPGLVQSAPREPRLHAARRPRAAAARDHDQPVVDGDRAREGARARSNS